MVVLIQDFFPGSSLDAAWTPTGVVSGDETFLSPGVTVANLGLTDRILQPCPAGDFAVELEFSGKSNGAAMLGPCILDNSGNGVVGSSYTAPAEVLLLGSSAYAYSGSFTSAGGSTLTTARFRITKTGANYTVAYSTNGGATWSAESPALSPSFTPTQVGIVDLNASGVSMTLIEFKVSTPATAPAATATASAAPPVLTATAVATPPAATAAATAPTPVVSNVTHAAVTPPAATATASAPAPVLTQTIFAGTDTSNSLNGRRRRARASVVVVRPAAAVPSRAAVKYDKSVPYPPPMLVNGRPT